MNKKVEDSVDFITITALMLKIMKYGQHGMKIKKKDFDVNKLKGKVIRVDSLGEYYKFTVVNYEI